MINIKNTYIPKYSIINQPAFASVKFRKKSKYMQVMMVWIHI